MEQFLKNKKVKVIEVLNTFESCRIKDKEDFMFLIEKNKVDLVYKYVKPLDESILNFDMDLYEVLECIQKEIKYIESMMIVSNYNEMLSDLVSKEFNMIQKERERVVNEKIIPDVLYYFCADMNYSYLIEGTKNNLKSNINKLWSAETSWRMANTIIKNNEGYFTALGKDFVETANKQYSDILNTLKKDNTFLAINASGKRATYLNNIIQQSDYDELKVVKNNPKVFLKVGVHPLGYTSAKNREWDTTKIYNEVKGIKEI